MYVILQLDGFNDDIQRKIRGVPFDGGQVGHWSIWPNSTSPPNCPTFRRRRERASARRPVRMLMERDHVLSC